MTMELRLSKKVYGFGFLHKKLWYYGRNISFTEGELQHDLKSSTEMWKLQRQTQDLILLLQGYEGYFPGILLPGEASSTTSQTQTIHPFMARWYTWKAMKQ